LRRQHKIVATYGNYNFLLRTFIELHNLYYIEKSFFAICGQLIII